MNEVYVVRTTVANVREIIQTTRAWKDANGETQAETKSLGWFILMSGSSEYLYVGTEKPKLSAGDPVEIIIRRR